MRSEVGSGLVGMIAFGGRHPPYGIDLTDVVSVSIMH